MGKTSQNKIPHKVGDSYVQAAIVDLWFQRDRTPADIQRIGNFQVFLRVGKFSLGLNFYWFFVAETKMLINNN